MKHIYDEAFRYVPAAKTDLRKSFAKYRREQAQADKKAADLRRISNVSQINRG